MNLFELNAAIEACIDEETGEILTDDLEALEMERDTKIENIACWIKNLTAEAAALKEEKMKMAKRQQAAENKIESLKNYLLRSMREGEKFKTARAQISQRSTPVLAIADGTTIPEEFLVYKAPAPDKTAIKAAIKAGRTIEGCSIESSRTITIK